MNRKTFLAAALAFLVLPAALPAAAQAPAAKSVAPTLTDGEVRKVDPAKGTVILKHAEIRNLDMPPMAMEFRAADPKLLAGLKPGDKVKFTAVMAGGVLTVTRIDVVK